MTWDQLLAQQTTRFTSLIMDAVRRCREIEKGAGDKDFRMVDKLARDAVALWSQSIDLMLGPLVCASPLLPHIHIDVPSSKIDGSAFLAHDVSEDKIVLTDLCQLGGTASIKSTDLTHEMGVGCLLSVKLKTPPAQSGLYQGFALKEAKTPIAVITVRA